MFLPEVRVVLNSSAKQAWQIVEPVVEGMGYEFVGAELIMHDGRGTFRVYIDQPDGITLDDCSAVSYQLSGVLDVEDPIRHPYNLEVSSPGFDRPLFRAQDFKRFAGQVAKIRLNVPQQGRRNFKGTLLGFDDGKVRIQVDKVVFELHIEQIERARLVPQNN